MLWRWRAALAVNTALRLPQYACRRADVTVSHVFVKPGDEGVVTCDTLHDTGDSMTCLLVSATAAGVAIATLFIAVL